jgi:RNA polymerase sigma-70 factor (ECF subfamily)
MLDWQELVTKYGPGVWRTAYRILADHADALDCYQETFLAIHRSQPKRLVEDWAAYLGALAARRAIDRLRERQRIRAATQALETEFHSRAAMPDPADEAVAAELLDRIRQVLSKLPDRQADVFWLSCIEGFSHHQIGAQLGVTPAAVRMLLHRARGAIQAALGAAYVNTERSK